MTPGTDSLMVYPLKLPVDEQSPRARPTVVDLVDVALYEYLAWGNYSTASQADNSGGSNVEQLMVWFSIAICGGEDNNVSLSGQSPVSGDGGSTFVIDTRPY